MLYQLVPDGHALWTALPASVRVADLRDDLVDVDEFDWQDTDDRTDETDVRLALRFGVPSRRGIVVDGRTLANHRQAKLIANSGAQASARQLNESDLIEVIEPDSRAHNEMQYAAVDDSIRTSVDQHEASVLEDLAAAPSADLVEHWERLGGRVPVHP